MWFPVRDKAVGPTVGPVSIVIGISSDEPTILITMFAPRFVAAVLNATRRPSYEMPIFSPCPIGLSPLPSTPPFALARSTLPEFMFSTIYSCVTLVPPDTLFVAVWANGTVFPFPGIEGATTRLRLSSPWLRSPPNEGLLMRLNLGLPLCQT